MTYNLLLKHARALDPGQGLAQVLDIAVEDKKIAAIAPAIPTEEAERTLDLSRPDRYVVPGLIDLHTHAAFDATTPGVGLEACHPDEIGVLAGVTTIVDAGSVGIANIGACGTTIANSKTRVLSFLNLGSYAHALQHLDDIRSLDDIDRKAIARVISSAAFPINGIKLRLMGSVMGEFGGDIVRIARQIASEHGLPLMVHIGDMHAQNSASGRERDSLTRLLLKNLGENDILTHLCTPHHGGVMAESDIVVPEVDEALRNGVTLDSALGAGNFGYRTAARQVQLGLRPHTISSDLSKRTVGFHSLLECMAKFMAIGYSLAEVVEMTTAAPARALHRDTELGAIAVGREADITIFDVVEGDFIFTDTLNDRFFGTQALVPVHTIRAGELIAPRWGTHPWGWLPAAKGA